MASATWSTGEITRPSLGRYTDSRGLLLEEEEDADDASGTDVGTPGGRRDRWALPAPVKRLLQRHMEMLHAAQETVLLLLIGVSANLIALVLDHLIETLVTHRARIAQNEESFLRSYAVWTGSALLFCTLSAMCVQFIGPAAAGSGIPQMKSVLAGERQAATTPQLLHVPLFTQVAAIDPCRNT
jgi:DNA-binding CsgD family transcriptional regulator